MPQESQALGTRLRRYTPSREIVGTAMMVGGAALWASSTVWLRRLFDVYALSPTGAMFWRDAIITLVLFLVLAPRGGLAVQRRHLGLLIAFGFIGIALNNASWGISVDLNGVTVATVMAYTAPIFVVILARPLYGEALTRRKVVALLSAIAGSLLVVQAYDLNAVSVRFFGIAVALLVGVTQAGRDLLGKKVSSYYPAVTGIFYGFLFGSIFLGLGQSSRGLVPSLSVQGWLELITMSLAIMLAYSLYLGSLARLPVSSACIVGLVEPVVAAVLAHLVHGEILALPQVIGSFLVIAGVVLLEIRGAG